MHIITHTVYPKKYAHGSVVLCFVVVMQSFIMNSHEVFIHIHQGCFADTGTIVRLPQCQWSKPDGYGKISQCITTTKHSKANTLCIFLGIYCMSPAPLFYLWGTLQYVVYGQITKVILVKTKDVNYHHYLYHIIMGEFYFFELHVLKCFALFLWTTNKYNI